jgi:hypothetical protein
MISIKRVINWMNVIRESKEEQYRILESFWESQLLSKEWILDVLAEKNIPCHDSVYVFGGWFGVLGGMLLDKYKDLRSVFSVDIDDNTLRVGTQLNPDVNFIVDDMRQFKYKTLPSLIINTSTEHITQEVYDEWVKNIPKYVPVVLQGNNYFSIDEHIRCAKNLDEFKRINPLDSIIYEGELDCKQFTRYMIIGYIL